MAVIAIEEALDQLDYQLLDVRNAVSAALERVLVVDSMTPEQLQRDMSDLAEAEYALADIERMLTRLYD